MKMIVSILLIALLSLAAGLYLPWWIIAPVAFLVTALIPQSPGRSFLSGFVALLLLWGTMALVISMQNEHLLAHKVSMVMFKIDHPALLIFATAMVGALVAAFAALGGSYVRARGSSLA